MKVLYIHRRATGGQVSVERLFDQIRRTLVQRIEPEIHVSPYPSRGLLPRLRNLVAARKAAGLRVCHITGDVHYIALGLPRKKIVLTIHDCGPLHRLGGWRREILRLAWFEWPARRAAVVTTISAATKEDLKQWLSPESYGKIRVVPNCTRDEFQPSRRVFNRSCPVFLQVGTGWNKNVDRVAEALVGIRCKLVIVGLLLDCQREGLERAGVDFTCLGRVDDTAMVEAYENCDALIFASLFEGFGLPILEAQAVGRPVITSNRSSMPEAAGDGALFVDPENVSSIRSAVLRLLSEDGLVETLVSRGFENVKRFSPESVAAQYERVYRSLDLQP